MKTSFILASFISFVWFVSPASAAVVVPTTLAQWTFETSIPATSGPFAAEVGSGQASGSHTNSSAVYSSPAGNGSAHSFSSNYWSVGDYYQFAISTSNYTNVALSWDQASSNTGPKDFKLQYSTNGTSFTDYASYSVLANASPNTPWSATGSQSSAYTLNYDLSSLTSLNNQSNVLFRLVMTDTVPAGSGATFGTGGTDRVDNFTVTGTAIPEPSTYAMIVGLLALGFAISRRR